METIFKDNAPKLLAMGYSVIPINRRSKTPMYFMQNWSQFSERLPTEEELNSWITRAPAAGIAIVCGRASNLIVIDIDDDNLLNDADIPRSPLVRRGKKGEARFFKYSDWAVNFSVAKKIDFLASARYIVIPPSIHPDTNEPYVWTGELKTMADQDYLPELNKEDIENLQIKYSQKNASELTGRNTKLKEMASAAYFNNNSEEETINELIEYDNLNHLRPLFNDPTEQYYRKTRNEKLAAQLFVKNVWQSLGRATQSNNSTITIIDKMTNNKEIVSIPVPTSPLLKKLVSTVLHNGIWYNESVAIGTALTAVSMLIANRFVLDNKWFPQGTPGNLFIMIIGETGIGKNSIKTLVTDIFGKTDFVEGYQSTSAAFLEMINSKRECLFLVDEISMHLRGLKNTKDVHTSAMCENLCDVFTANTNMFLPTMTLAAKSKHTNSKIYNPYLSILSATTPKGLQENANDFLVEKGLLPRFLFFKQEEAQIFQNPESKPESYAFWLKDFFKQFQNEYPIKEEEIALNARKVIHRKIPLSSEAQVYFDDMLRADNLRRLSGDTSMMKDFLKRKMELISRVCLIDAISSGNMNEASLENLKYAENVFEFSTSCIKEHVPIIFGSDYGRQRQSVLNYISKKSKVGKKELNNRFRNIHPNEKTKIITDLLGAGSIAQVNQKMISGKEQECYVFVEDIV